MTQAKAWKLLSPMLLGTLQLSPCERTWASLPDNEQHMVEFNYKYIRKCSLHNREKSPRCTKPKLTTHRIMSKQMSCFFKLLSVRLFGQTKVN